MITFDRRLRSLVVAIVAVIFSASLVVAAQPASPGASPHDNGNHGAKAGQHASDEPDASEEANEPADNEDTTDSGDSSDHCNVDLTQDPSVLATLDHGSVVCTAAHMATPAGYANHGAWVSHWAHLGKGSDNAAKPKASPGD